MPAMLPTELTSPSRRALLAGALGGLGAVVAAALGRAAPVRAEGQTVVVGGEYDDATSETRIANNTNNEPAIVGINNQNGVGVDGYSYGYRGVRGASQSGVGVHGQSGSSNGVRGDSATGIAIRGEGGLGVAGYSNNPGGIGVWGQASGGQGRGVHGFSSSGHGVHGQSNTGYAGYFDGKVFTAKFYEMTEITTPPAPSSVQRARLFVRNSGGKTQLCVRFATGAVKVLATET